MILENMAEISNQVEQINVHGFYKLSNRNLWDFQMLKFMNRLNYFSCKQKQIKVYSFYNNLTLVVTRLLAKKNI